MNWTVTIVEDEPGIATLVADYLQRDNINSCILESGENAVEKILGDLPDLVILDIMLPGKDGLTICREIRAKSNVPIIIETARVEEIDRLLGLEIGADDYVCKPFSPRELVARVKAILRRIERDDNSGEENGGSDFLQIDREKWQATANGIRLDLTRREFQILSILHNRPGRVFSRAQLLDLAFNDEADVYDRTIDSHVKNLRQKLKNTVPDWDPVRSVYGVGYAFDK